MKIKQQNKIVYSIYKLYIKYIKLDKNIINEYIYN